MDEQQVSDKLNEGCAFAKSINEASVEEFQSQGILR